MTAHFPITASPALSPEFNKARRLSRGMTVVLGIGIWVTIVWLAALLILLIWPSAGGWGDVGGSVIAPSSLSFGARAGALLAIFLGTAPSLLVLHHARRIFANFARGEVFIPSTIAHIRSAGLWLIVSGFASGVEEILFNLFAGVAPAGHDHELKPVLLVFGVAVYIAAYVMAEAQRVSDDNAAIV